MAFLSSNSYIDFSNDQTFHQLHDFNTELDLHRITSCFYGAVATVVTCQQGTLTLRTPCSVPFWDLLMLQLLRPAFPNLPCLFSTFHLEYFLVFSRFCFDTRLALDKPESAFIGKKGRFISRYYLIPKFSIGNIYFNSSENFDEHRILATHRLVFPWTVS